MPPAGELEELDLVLSTVGDPRYISFLRLTPGVASSVFFNVFWHLTHTILEVDFGRVKRVAGSKIERQSRLFAGSTLGNAQARDLQSAAPSSYPSPASPDRRYTQQS